MPTKIIRYTGDTDQTITDNDNNTLVTVGPDDPLEQVDDELADYLVKSKDEYEYYNGTKTLMNVRYSIVNGRHIEPDRVDTDTLQILDSASDPSKDGEFTRNGSKVMVQSGGETFDLSNVAGEGLATGALADRPAAGSSAPPIYVVTDGGDSNDGVYVTYNDGSAWTPAAYSSDHFIFEDGFELGRSWHIAPQTGLDIATEIETLLGAGYTDIVIHQPADATRYTWDKRLNIDLGNYPNGVKIDVKENVAIEGSVLDWWLWVDGLDGGQEATFHYDHLHGEVEFIGSQTANPGCPGFIHVQDQNEPYIRVNTRGFQNGTGNGKYNTTAGDARAIMVENIDTFSEGARFEGNQRACDIGLDITVENQTGSGTNSVRDAMIAHFSAAGRDYCVSLNGNHKGINVNDLHMFPQLENSVGLELDGNFEGGHFAGITVDDTGGNLGTTGIVTGPDFISPSIPVFYGLAFNNVETAISKNGSNDDVIEIFGDGGTWGIRDVEARDGSGASMEMQRPGGFTTFDDTNSEVFNVRSDGVVSTPSQTEFRIGQGLYVQGPTKSELNPGTPFLGTNQASVVFDDGTNFQAGTLICQSDVGDNESPLMPIRHPDGSESLPKQDLSALSLGAAEDGRMYQHNGASLISADGGTSDLEGYYVWSDTDQEFKSVVTY